MVKITTALFIGFVLMIMAGTASASDECPLEDEQREQARNAFKSMLSALRHPRCANCHGAINVFDENTQHMGGPQLDYEEDIFSGERVAVPLGQESCTMCHDAAKGKWRQSVAGSEIQWAKLSDRGLWKRLQTTRIITDHNTRASANSTGILLIKHIKSDPLIAFGFQGMRAMTENSEVADIGLMPDLDPPPLTKKEFLQATGDWIRALDALDSWPEEDCSVVLDEKIGEGDFSGTWKCPVHEPIKITQTDTLVKGTVSGKAFNSIETRNMTGKVDGDELELTLNYKDGSYSKGKLTLIQNGAAMMGDWLWYSKRGNVNYRGRWTCERISP